MFELMESQLQNAVIKVIGVGGGGGNAVEHMSIQNNTEEVDFYAANTDAQALRKLAEKNINVLQLGDMLTKGLGAGANPDIGRKAAEEDRELIEKCIAGADMVFITAGMGGGTGTGAAPVIARIAKELGILTVAVVTKPFSFEGKQRAQAAERGIQELTPHVDSLIIIPNNKLITVLGKNVSLLKAFAATNDVLQGAVKGISDLITRPGLINVDFADVRTVMSEMGMAMMGTGAATGEQRARQAAEAAIASPLLEDVNLSGAKGILVNITGGLDMSIGEFEEVGDVIKAFISDDATVVVGTVIDPNMGDELKVTVIVTGLGDRQRLQPSSLTEMAQQSVRARLVENMKPDGSFDYTQLERPAVVRKQNAMHANAMDTKFSATKENAQTEADYLDIPAFLRRQEAD